MTMNEEKQGEIFFQHMEPFDNVSIEVGAASPDVEMYGADHPGLDTNISQGESTDCKQPDVYAGLDNKEVTLSEAIEGLQKAIAYMESNPAVNQSYAKICLKKILGHLYQYNAELGSHTLVEDVNDKQDGSNPEECKELIEDELVGDRTFLEQKSEFEGLFILKSMFGEDQTAVDTSYPSVVAGCKDTTTYVPGENVPESHESFGKFEYDEEDTYASEDTSGIVSTVEAPVKRKRGRPKGSTKAKNRAKSVNHFDSHSSELNQKTVIKSKRVRPKVKKEASKQTKQKNTAIEDMILCVACGKWFASLGILERHVSEAHIGLRPFKCDVCQKTFIRSSHLRRHMDTHSGQRDFLCTECGQSYTRASHLKRHHDTIHVGDRPYACDTCGKTFFQNYNLQEHMVTHSTVRPYTCDICGRAYGSSTALRVHMKYHIADKKPHACSTCGKIYHTIANLRVHVRREHTHEQPYKCPTCGKLFMRASNCRIHMILHTGEKPFKCPVCDRQFANPGSLFQHKRIHSGIKPYHCEICDKRFGHSGRFNKHKLIHQR